MTQPRIDHDPTTYVLTRATVCRSLTNHNTLNIRRIAEQHSGHYLLIRNAYTLGCLQQAKYNDTLALRADVFRVLTVCSQHSLVAWCGEGGVARVGCCGGVPVVW